MTRHHPLDGNMIAADAHYERDDYVSDTCDMCGAMLDGEEATRDDDATELCSMCADFLRDEQ